MKYDMLKEIDELQFKVVINNAKLEETEKVYNNKFCFNLYVLPCLSSH